MNRITIITGAANGIGRQLARDLLKVGGYQLVLVDIDLDKLRCEFADTDAECHQLDITDADQWRQRIDATVETHGSLDLICNIAGIVEPGWVEEAEVASIDRHIDINVKGVMYGTKLAAEQMVRQRSGHIINIASLAGIAITPGISFYGASKHAVRGFTLTMASELREKGIHVTCICPGVVETGMLDDQIDRPEGAITFAGGKPLTTAEVSKTIQNAISKRPVEVCIRSGFLPKVVNALPNFGPRLYGRFKVVGAKSAEKLRRSSPHTTDES